ncbi:hypothetical protein IAU59_001766 [Kwoniella sp. CBS 9459]
MTLSLRSIRCHLRIPILNEPAHCAPQRPRDQSTSAPIKNDKSLAIQSGQGKGEVRKVHEVDMEERGGTAPNGQVLPDWLTYLSYVTTINDMPYTVETIAALPLTYYGPSIPLGDGWTYGGLTSPTGTIGLAPPATARATATATEDTTEAQTTPQAAEGQSETMGIETTSSQYSSSSAAPSSSNPSSISDPRTTTSVLSTTSTLAASASSSTQTRASRSGTVSVVSSSTSTTTEPPLIPFTAEPTPSASSSESGENTGRNLLAPLLATLLPLGIILLIILFLYCIYQKNRHSRDSGVFGALRHPFGPSRFTKLPRESDTVPSTAAAATGNVGEKRSRGDPTLLGGMKSPDEKSALLPGFTAQHHRSSSSISSNIEHERRDEAQVDDELRDLARQNQSLLQRLTLGLGWLTPSNNSSSTSIPKAGTNKGRVASGNTLEKGGGGSRIFSSEASAIAAGVFGWGRARTGQTQGTGGGGAVGHTPSTASSAGYERVLDDDQLFYLPPRNQSSTGSRSRTGSATGSPSIPTTGTSSNSNTQSNRYSGQRRSWINPNALLREEDGEASGSRTFSVGVPETPGLEDVDLGDGYVHAGDHDRDHPHGSEFEKIAERVERVSEHGRTRWSNTGERMRFPIPPGLGLYDEGTFGEASRRRSNYLGLADEGRRESYMSGDTQYYSAHSRSSEDHPTPVADFTPPSSGDPIPRDSEGYRHASVSASGSHPATPTRPPRSFDHSSVSLLSPGGGSNESPIRLISPFASPSRYDSPRTDENGQASAARVRMSYLFSPTPEPRRSEDPGVSGNDSRGSGGDELREKRRSYLGQPLIDDTLRSTHERIGEFGEPLKYSALLSPTLVPSGSSPHSSETGSLGLVPSNTHTHSSSSRYSHATSGSGQGSTKDLSEVSHEQVLRGQRSKGRLVRASVIGGMTAESSSGGGGGGGQAGEEENLRVSTRLSSEMTAVGEGGKWFARWRG